MKKNNTLVSVLIIAILLVVIVAGYFIKNQVSEKLIISGHPEWAPIMYQQDDEIVGAGEEIASMIFKELGVETVSKYEGTWDVVQNKMKSGVIDVLVAAYKTTEREAYMNYSIPYTVDPVVLVVKKGYAFPYSEWGDLVNKKGVVTTGDSYGIGFDNYIEESLIVQNVSTVEEAFTLLDNEEVDYFVYALYSAENYIFNNDIADQVEIIPNYVSAENFYLTISKKSPFAELLPEINVLLEGYINDGVITEIIEKHKQSLWNDNI